MADLQPDRWEQLLHEAARGGAGTPQRIAELCVDTLEVTGAGVSLVTDTGIRQVVCATDDVAMRIEEMQVTLGEGPCVDAIGGGGPVLVSDVTDRGDLTLERWPTFLAAVGAGGLRAVFAFPLRIGVINLGALDLYRSTPGPLRDDQLGAALRAAEAAGVAMLSAYAPEPDQFADESDREHFQAQVHQATGMVMVQARVTIEQAFLLLRAHAFANSRPLSDVAADVVGRRLRFDPEDV